MRRGIAMTEIWNRRLGWAWGMCALVLSLTIGTAEAVVTTIPQSALIPSTTYYTDSIGGGIGDIVDDATERVEGGDVAFALAA